MKSNEAIRFLRQFQELLAEGGFVATYKFALLQALADLSVGTFESARYMGPAELLVFHWEPL